MPTAYKIGKVLCSGASIGEKKMIVADGLSYGTREWKVSMEHFDQSKVKNWSRKHNNCTLYV